MEYLNKQYLLDKRPTGMPQDDCWKLNENLITSLKKNEIIIEVKYLSIDPYMRGRMNDSKSYAAPAKIGEPMTGETAGVVIESNSDLFKVGDKYRLIQYGEKIVDSYTKESLGRKEKIVGMIEITEVTPKMSYGKILNTSIKDIEAVFKPKGFIIRSLPESMKEEDNIKKQEDMRKKIEEEFDENW